MAQQNTLDFLVAAHVSGMEQMAKLMNSVGALQKETEKLKTAMAGLEAGAGAGERGIRKMNGALDEQSKALRNQRQGTQQLGMQFNDLATSISTGASPVQAFNQQLGQMGYAMSMMGGTAGKVGAFLAGPWGAAITLAAMALTPLIEKLFGVSEEMKKAEKAAANLDTAIAARKDAEYALRLALADTAAEYRNIRIEMMNNALTAVNAAKIELMARQKVVTGLLRERQAMQQEVAGAGGMRAQAEMGTGQFLDRRQNTKALQDATTLLNADVANLEQLTTKLLGSIVDVVSGGGPRGRTARKAAMTDAQREAKKVAEATARWTKAFPSEGINKAADVYEDYRIMMIKSTEFSNKRMEDLDDEMFRNSIDRARQMAKELGYITEDFNAQQAEQITKPYQELQNSFMAIGESVSNAFKGMITGATSWKDAMRGIIGSVIDELWRLYVVQQIVGFVTKALGKVGAPNPTTPFDSTITVTRGRAVGGYVAAQTPYVVGEKGPELFVPGGSGTIIPNKNMGGAGGGGGVTVNVDARGSADPAAVRAQVEAGIIQAAPAIIAAAQQRTVSSLRRPKLGGAMQ